MAIIRVPAPPPEAFQKHRPVSDLIKSQIKHFQHLEQKLHLNLPTKFSPHDLTTESAAAQYIAEMTTALCDRTTASQKSPTPIRAVPPPATKSSRKSTRQPEIAIAASAAPSSAKKRPVKAKKHAPAKRTKHPRKKS
jgi:hypothetical protein